MRGIPVNNFLTRGLQLEIVRALTKIMKINWKRGDGCEKQGVKQKLHDLANDWGKKGRKKPIMTGFLLR